MPSPEPWVLAAAAALSVTLAVLVVYNGMIAFRLWRVRKQSLGTLQDRGPQGPDAAAHDAMVRFRASPTASPGSGTSSTSWSSRGCSGRWRASRPAPWPPPR